MREGRKFITKEGRNEGTKERTNEQGMREGRNICNLVNLFLFFHVFLFSFSVLKTFNFDVVRFSYNVV